MQTAQPWFRQRVRWGQTNLTEIDPIRYDRDWWRQHWRNTRVQGVIINAGGIVAYYPSRLELQHRAIHLGDRDLFGEITQDAREEGLAVVARMDSNRADERFYLEHPDWFTVDQAGVPYRAGELFIACIFSPYYETFLPAVLKEVIERYQPEGFADNSWSGLQRDRICYCVNCRRKFRDHAGADLPTAHDWDDPIYRTWIRWNYARRIEIWELNNATTRGHGGEHCLWVGMNAGDIVAQSKHFRDYKAIAERAEIIFLDSQYRHPGMGFQRNGEAGALLHDMLGWDKLIPESMAMYGAGQPSFRLASKSPGDARLWALDGFSGGIQPWWHHIGAYHDDRRQYQTAEPLFRWHEQNEQHLLDRRPAATVGVVWSQENADFYGRHDPETWVKRPWNGMTDALIRARIPYVPVHADNMGETTSRLGLTTLVLPNVGRLTDAQCHAVREFVANGGGLVATGETSLYDDDGLPRHDFGLSDVLGVHATGTHHGADSDTRTAWDQWSQHTYLRLSPERRRWVYGPTTGDEPDDDIPRHPVFDGFEETDTIPFGGRIEVVQPGDDVTALMTLIPPFPIYPPETSWMRYPTSNVPGLVIRETDSGGRVAYLAADLDGAFERMRLPDHAALLSNLVRWSAGDRVPIQVEGAGFVHCAPYWQGSLLVLHLVNLTGHESGHAPVADYFPSGPLTVRLPGVAARSARLLVEGRDAPVTQVDDGACIEISRINDHEVVVFETA